MDKTRPILFLLLSVHHHLFFGTTSSLALPLAVPLLLMLHLDPSCIVSSQQVQSF